MKEIAGFHDPSIRRQESRYHVICIHQTRLGKQHASWQTEIPGRSFGALKDASTTQPQHRTKHDLADNYPLIAASPQLRLLLLLLLFPISLSPSKRAQLLAQIRETTPRSGDVNGMKKADVP
ncbi:predicted protein [Histoplasma capsulatum H143]|uniref:Uncharacterized protein n=1 Tax=Ajellomyces capsulatus (strain H143) TaxID=544712 RepID=C6H4D1_AJECH|nr:predicted protein [Histoplasma capsulatum H143]